jgi:DNA mismatch repair protein MLH3
VRNLFGNLPVRVKQRAVVVEQKAEHDRLLEGLKRDVTGLLLSWRKPVALKLRDAVHNTVLTFSGLTTTSETLHSSALGKDRPEELQFLLNVLTQANYLAIDDWQSWVPASASTTSISIRGAISLEPSPTRRIQFISLGIRALSTGVGHNELYDEVNRMFSQSSFGMVEDDADMDNNEKSRRQADRRFKNDGYTYRQLTGRKGVDRYPKFHLRVAFKEKARSRPLEDQLLEEDANLQAVIEVLRAMITEWLSVHHFRPRKRRQRPDSASTTMSNDKLSQAPTPLLQPPLKSTAAEVNILKISSENSESRKRKSSALIIDANVKRTQSQSFINWSRIKSGKSRFDDSVWASRKSRPICSNDTAPLGEQDQIYGTTENDSPLSTFNTFPATTILQGSLDVPVRQNPHSQEVDVSITDEANLGWNSGDETMLGTDPVTKRIFRLNARTGCVIPPSASHAVQNPGRNDFQQTLRLPQGPKGTGNTDTLWLDSLLETWNNPIFQTTEKSIPRSAFDEGEIGNGCHSQPGHLGCSRVDINKVFNEATTSGSSKLSKEGLRNARVIAQLDKKFILIKMPKWEQSEQSDADALVLIDQHAADERVRVESLLTELCAPLPDTRTHAQYRSKLGHKAQVAFTILDKPLQFSITPKEHNLFITHAARFAAWGILYSTSASESLVTGPSTDGRDSPLLSVNTLPPIITERCKLDPKPLISFLRSTVWKYDEEPHPHSVLLDGNSEHDGSARWLRRLSSCPQGLVDLVNSRACRSAIMFNDELNFEQCSGLLERLSTCVFPFMCAHGRPSMIPLVNLGEISLDAPTLERGMGTEGDEGDGNGFIGAWKKWRQE